MKGDVKRARLRVVQDRLLRLFDGEGYEEFHTSKYIFVKQWNGNTRRWQVAIYPIESWRRVEEYKHNLVKLF